jgi:hypothetical protein
MRDSDRQTFLELIRRGYNEASACRQLDYDLAQLSRKKRVDSRFRAEIKEATDEANRRLLQVLGQDRARRVLAQLDRQARQRQVLREKQLAQAQRHTAKVVAGCNALEDMVRTGAVSPQAVAARVVGHLLNGSMVSNGHRNGLRKRA